ncbi:hypothetical protein EDD21DRAFT_179802 [Dissophora ornata]|nr:hypothetical protein EDD21DRAFT_179802 [Dissophora ornata]
MCSVCRDKCVLLCAIEHYLVMPRERLEKLHQLSGAHGVETIERLQKRGEWLIDILQKEKPYLKFTMGFHVIPSMLQIHLHVISLDFHSKHNRWPPHYNSFTTAFFIHPNDLITTLNERGHFWLSVPELQWYREQKKAPLQCNQCVFLAQNMKGLKLHLEDHVRAMMAPEQ